MQAGTEKAWGSVGSGVFVGGWKKRRTQSGSVLGPRCGLRPVCQGHELGQDPACFSAGTEMWAQEYWSGP